MALLPTLGLDKLFNGNDKVTIAVPLTIIVAVVVWVVLSKTKLGYELKATGNNRNAAKYAGMAQNRNIIMTLMISGALAGLGETLWLTCLSKFRYMAAKSKVGDAVNDALLLILGQILKVISSSFTGNTK